MQVLVYKNELGMISSNSNEFSKVIFDPLDSLHVCTFPCSMWDWIYFAFLCIHHQPKCLRLRNKLSTLNFDSIVDVLKVFINIDRMHVLICLSCNSLELTFVILLIAHLLIIASDLAALLLSLRTRIVIHCPMMHYFRLGLLLLLLIRLRLFQDLIVWR